MDLAEGRGERPQPRKAVPKGRRGLLLGIACGPGTGEATGKREALGDIARVMRLSLS